MEEMDDSTLGKTSEQPADSTMGFSKTTEETAKPSTGIWRNAVFFHVIEIPEYNTGFYGGTVCLGERTTVMSNDDDYKIRKLDTI